jgi:hypothetical protein
MEAWIMARSFSTGATDRIDLGASATLNPGSMAISCWFQVTAKRDFNTLSELIITAGNAVVWEFGLGGSGFGSNNVLVAGYSNSNTGLAITGVTSLSLNIWYHGFWQYDSASHTA